MKKLLKEWKAQIYESADRERLKKLSQLGDEEAAAQLERDKLRAGKYSEASFEVLWYRKEWQDEWGKPENYYKVPSIDHLMALLKKLQKRTLGVSMEVMLDGDENHTVSSSPSQEIILTDEAMDGGGEMKIHIKSLSEDFKFYDRPSHKLEGKLKHWAQITELISDMFFPTTY